MNANNKPRGKHARTTQKSTEVEELKEQLSMNSSDTVSGGQGASSGGDADATQMLPSLQEAERESSSQSDKSGAGKAEGAAESSDGESNDADVTRALPRVGAKSEKRTGPANEGATADENASDAAKTSASDSVRSEGQADKANDKSKRGYKAATAGASEEKEAKRAVESEPDASTSENEDAPDEKKAVPAEKGDDEVSADSGKTMALNKAPADEAGSGEFGNANAASNYGYGVTQPASTAPYAAYPPYGQGESSGSGFVAAGLGEIALKRRRNGLKVFGVTVGILVAVLLLVYVIGAVIFMGRFLPSTFIGGKDVSMKSNEEVVAALNDVVSDYRLDIVGGGFSYRLTGADVGLSLDANGIVKAMHEDMNAWEWPLLILQPKHDETSQLVITSNKASYEPGLTAEIEKYNETAKDPVNATIEFKAETNKFVVRPEEAGTKLSVEAVLASTAEAIGKLDSKLSVGDDELIKPTVYSTDQKLIEAAELASGMVSARLSLVMGGKEVGMVDGSMLSEFVTVNEEFEVTFREEDLDGWISGMAEGFNTVGTERVYTRDDGKVIAVSGGVYGWEVDGEALKNVILDAVRAGTVGELEVPCSGTAAVYNGPNERDWGARYIDVDISEQYVRFYGDDGAIIWEAPCISGMPDGEHDTRMGVWSVNAKESPSKLIGYENGKKIYETMVQYWMPFEGNGIGFHDATWQPSFGGSMYANGYGSHGCVNLSYSDAQTLYGIIDYDDVVVVHG